MDKGAYNSSTNTIQVKVKIYFTTQPNQVS